MRALQNDPVALASAIPSVPASDLAARSGTSGCNRPTVWFINRSYWPDAEATGQLLTELCEDLSVTFDVHVIAGQPNSNPTNEPYRRRGTEQRNGVQIHRAWHTRFSKGSLTGRCLNQIGFFLGALWSTIVLPRPDVVVVETDPFFLTLLGIWLRWRHRCRLIVSLQDIYPDIAVALGKLREGILARTLRRLLTRAYRRAHRVVVLSQDMRDVVIEQGLNPMQIEILPNWVDTKRIVPIKEQNGFRAGAGLDRKFVVMYSGNMGLSQPLDVVLRAADRLRERPEIQFLLVGDGVAKRRLQDDAETMRLHNVRFLPYQPRKELARSLSAADLHIVAVDPRVCRLLMPCKIYAIFASGTPLVAIAPPESELSRIVSSQRVGITVAPGDANSLIDAIRWGAENRHELERMGERARHLAVTRFDRRSATQRFGVLVTAVLKEPLLPAGVLAGGR
jgi:glycosyltransferase involved in cell wall biosynthesis